MIVVNNAASGYVKALQHAMYGGRYQSSDLVEMNYAKIARGDGLPAASASRTRRISPAPPQRGMAERDRPTVIDVVDDPRPGQMLPAADSRTQ